MTRGADPALASVLTTVPDASPTGPAAVRSPGARTHSSPLVALPAGGGMRCHQCGATVVHADVLVHCSHWAGPWPLCGAPTTGATVVDDPGDDAVTCPKCRDDLTRYDAIPADGSEDST